MSRPLKPKRWWAVTYRGPSRDVMPDTIRRTRREAQRACCDNRYRYRDDPDEWWPEWQEWHRLGCRAVRVIVTVDPTP